MIKYNKSETWRVWSLIYYYDNKKTSDGDHLLLKYFSINTESYVDDAKSSSLC